MTTGLVSVLIPARTEMFLYKTTKDLLAKARGPIEILISLDGYWIEPKEIVDDPRVIYLHYGSPRGMRNGINQAAIASHGEFLMKSDAHCMYDEGFDLKLKAGVATYTERTDNTDAWIVIPRRLRLDAENWCIQQEDSWKPPVDYEYLSSPADAGVKGNIWNERTQSRKDKSEFHIDENLSFQGSCWFMTRNHYLNRLGGMSEEGYGNFVREAQEIGLKTWLGGGKIFTNKNTWYAHLHKGNKYGRGYYIDKFKMIDGNKYCDDFWFNNRWTEAKHDMAWLIERFMPVPTWTPELIEQVRKK
jgi:glycosyltransferase involved in cell wall biosynthesis